MKLIHKIPIVFMRGGTSRGVIFKEKDLPKEKRKRDEIILQIYGSPDTNQINGIGGATSVTSKTAIINTSKRENIDIEYTFGQVSIDSHFIDYKPTCGNMATAVGLYAAEEGMVKLRTPKTIVRIFNTNTNKVIEVKLNVNKDGISKEKNYSISGVPGKSSRIDVSFIQPGGAITSELFPTGNLIDKLSLSNGQFIEVSVIDSANVLIFLQGKDIGLEPYSCNDDIIKKDILVLLEEIRQKIGVRIGLMDKNEQISSSTHALPKIAVVHKGGIYKLLSGEINDSSVNIIGQYISMGKLHQAFAVSGAMALASCAKLKGTVVYKLLEDSFNDKIRIGHPSGSIDVEAKIKYENNDVLIESVSVGRTARRIMDGFAYINN